MATSPPHPGYAALPNPRKRPSLSAASLTSTGTTSSNKRPKLHPLRQTSFPAQPSTATFSATAARSDTGSLLSTATPSGTPEKRGRGRPRKPRDPSSTTSAHIPSLDASQHLPDDTGSLVSGPAGARGATKSMLSGRSLNALDGNAAEDEEEDEEWGGPTTLDATDVAHAAEQREEENRKLSRLISTFPAEHDHRYNMYKRSTLNKSTLKRIVNSTVSQSVTQLPLVAVGSYSKYFVGEIVTRACEVQREWAWRWEEGERSRREKREKERGGWNGDAEAKKKGDAEDEQTRHNPHKGGLLPDHLREALRRYKADGEGGGVGLGGMSLGGLGVKGEAVWRLGSGLGGRRLFR